MLGCGGKDAEKRTQSRRFLPPFQRNPRYMWLGLKARPGGKGEPNSKFSRRDLVGGYPDDTGAI